MPREKSTPSGSNHYKGKRFEAIDVIEEYELPYCLANAVKYILRLAKSEDPADDLLKAENYIHRQRTGAWIGD